jgi:uncharacterized membrane protein YgcG
MRRDVLRLIAVIAPPALAVVLGACSWDLGKVFDRDDPRVEQARRDLEASVANPEADLAPTRASLEDFLGFRCVADGGQDLVVDRPFASVDLGLVTFRVAELVGQRFGDEESDAGERAEAIAGRRAQELECAHLLLLRVVKDPKTPPALALRARYLLGNFAFLARRYQDAIDDYDQVLLQHPARGVLAADAGPADDEDAIARDAAWNRAIALLRLEDEKKRDAGPDADDAPDGRDAPPDVPDASDGSDAPDASDGSEGGSPDGGEAGQGDSGDGGGGDSGGGDARSDGAQPQPQPQPPKPSPSTSAKPMPSTAVNLQELNRFDEKSPLDLELPFKKRPRLPRSLDK